MKLIFATQNNNKIKEINALLSNKIKICSLANVNIFEELEETGFTFKENARQKAITVYNITGLNCFADDTGLETEALQGKPGVYSARYAGAHKSTADNIQLLLSQLNNHTNRNAVFKTVICLLLNGKEYYFEGILEGKISTEPKGAEGFGYDPVFMPNGYTKTLAELTIEEKNKISHRAIAFKKLTSFLSQIH